MKKNIADLVSPIISVSTSWLILITTDRGRPLIAEVSIRKSGMAKRFSL
jgi:hypothetical protein